MSDVTVRTQQLIDYLNQLTQASRLTKDQLEQLEVAAKSLKIGDVADINSAIKLLFEFRENLRGMGVDSIAIYNATQYYVQLTRALNLASNEQERFNALAIAKQANIAMGKLGTPGYGGKGIGYTPAEQAQYAVLEQQRDAALAKARGIYQQAPVISAQYGNDLQKTLQLEEQITFVKNKENDILNQQIAKQQKLVNQVIELLSVQEKLSTLEGKYGRTSVAGGIFGTKEELKAEQDKRVVLGGAGEAEGTITGTGGPFTTEALQKEVGLSATAADNLNKRLGELGMTEGRVLSASKELSTGITTVSMSLEKSGQVTKTYTAHIGRAGEILQDTQRRFRSFGSAVMRDVVEVLKWTIAIGAIYGPIRKLGELLQQTKDIQLAMVDVQIVLGSSTEKMNTAFEASARVATETSSSLLGVIQGYSLAAGAAASAGNDFERLAATESLLKNSMILAKLAGTDQKAALDTLVGAISQAGLKLTEGTKLLDSWVAVSKRSNVSVNQMATTFSIVGSAAQEVGLTFDQLNGMVGAMAQATNLSADEIGNAIRGIIAAMQTDKASAEFAKYGIATKNLNGDMRDLMEIFREIKVMQQTGILDEKAMGALMQAGGAGARRGAQLSALVKNLSLVMDLTTVSQNASGDAAKAMALEMETLDAATTRLNNAFTELAKTLGTEGGILDFLTLATKGATALVKGIRELVTVMKWAAPVFATFMLAKGIAGTATGLSMLGNTIPKAMQLMLTSPKLSGLAGTAGNLQAARMSPEITRLMQVAGNRPSTTVPINELSYGALLGGIGQKLMQPLFPKATGPLGVGTNLTTSISSIFSKINWASLLGPAIIAATNIGRPAEEGIPRAIAGGLGAIPGILAGNPIWATIGSIIATGFYDKFLTLEGSMAATWAQFITEHPQKAPTAEELATPQTWAESIISGIKTTLEGPPPPPEAPLAPQLPSLEEIIENLDKSIIGNMSATEKMNINFQQLIGAQFLSKEEKAAGLKEIYSNEGMLILATYLAQKQGKTLEGKTIGEYDVGLGRAVPAPFRPETMAAIEKYLNLFMIKQVEEGFSSTKVETTKTAEIQKLSQLASNASADLMKKALEEIASGATSGLTNLTNAQQIVKTLQVSAGTLITAQQQTPGMPTITGPEAVNILANLTPEESEKLQTAVSDITNGLSQLEIVQGKINEQKTAGVQVDQTYIDTEIALNTQIANGRQLLSQLYPALKQVALARQAEAMMKPTVEIPVGITEEQLQKAVIGAEQMWREYLESQNIPPEMLEAWMAQQEEQILMAKDKVFSTTTKVPSKFLNLQLEEMGLAVGGAQISDYTQITRTQLAQMLPQYNILKQQLMQLGYQPNEQQTILQLQDGFALEHIDNIILQLLMRDLIDVEKEKGLQGMYNLPAGATFYVPVTAYEMSKATVTEMAGGGGLAGTADIIAQLAELLRTLGTGTEYKYNLQGKPASPITAPTAEDIARMRATGNYEWPPKTAPTITAPTWTTGNPLPVTIMNWMQNNQIPGQEPGLSTSAIPQWLTPQIQQQGTGLSTPVTPVPPAPSPELNILEKLFQWLSNVGLLPQFNITPDQTTGMGTNNVPITTALNLAVDSIITLTVDGRTLATIIKPFLYEDLIRYMTSANSSINRSVIG